MLSPIKKIKEKKTGETYPSKKAMVKHEKSESKSYEKKEYKKGKKSPLKMLPRVTFSNKDLGIGNTTKNNSITGNVMDSLQKSFNPKSRTFTVNKSPFRKMSKTTKKTK